jgi:hypothetical protein
MLLWDAAMRAARSEIAVVALVVDAKDDQAEAFYLHHDFVAFGPGQLLYPLTNFAAKRNQGSQGTLEGLSKALSA